MSTIERETLNEFDISFFLSCSIDGNFMLFGEAVFKFILLVVWRLSDPILVYDLAWTYIHIQILTLIKVINKVILHECNNNNIYND